MMKVSWIIQYFPTDLKSFFNVFTEEKGCRNFTARSSLGIPINQAKGTQVIEGIYSSDITDLSVTRVQTLG